MSRDDDDDDADPPASALPPGTPNYITPAGHARMIAERDQLARVDRPRIVEIVSWAAGNGDRSENGDYIYGKKRLREIDRRLRFLIKRLAIAQIVDPARPVDRTRVFFGATVTYADGDDAERTVRIVGVDEAELSRGEVSLYSPIARALMRAACGDRVWLQTPQGREAVEVLEIRYD